MQYVIFHGTFGSKDGNWFPWLEQELTQKGHSVIRHQFPTETHQEVTDAQKNDPGYKPEKITLKNWLEDFKNNILPQLDPSKEIIFVGHSLGPLFILNILNTFDLKLKKAIFVAPFLDLTLSDQAFQVVVDDFSSTELDFEKINSKLGESIVFYSDNDPYVPPVKALGFAEKTNANTILVQGGGHMSATSGFTSFPQLLAQAE